jgi:hypothetical protein
MPPGRIFMKTAHIAAAVALLFVSTDAFAGANSRYSHCYKIKDTQAKALYTVDLVPNDFRFPDVDGCEIKVPAKAICVDSYDIGLTPAPVGGATGGFNGQKYLCYKAKCPVPATTLTVGVGDALGIRTVTASKTQQVCVPIPADTCVSAADCRDRQNQTTAACGTNGYCEADVCDSGYDDCNGFYGDGCETSTSSDTSSCGGCGNICPEMNAYASCTAGTCGFDSCYPGYADCNIDSGDGCEVDVTSDVNNCGTCNTICSFPNATAVCASSSCVIGACDTGYGDCNIDSGDGCETFLNGSDVNNCGGCNTVCAFGESCTAGVCVP